MLSLLLLILLSSNAISFRRDKSILYAIAGTVLLLISTYITFNNPDLQILKNKPLRFSLTESGFFFIMICCMLDEIYPHNEYREKFSIKFLKVLINLFIDKIHTYIFKNIQTTTILFLLLCFIFTLMYFVYTTLYLFVVFISFVGFLLNISSLREILSKNTKVNDLILFFTLAVIISLIIVILLKIFIWCLSFIKTMYRTYMNTNNSGQNGGNAGPSTSGGGGPNSGGGGPNGGGPNPSHATGWTDPVEDLKKREEHGWFRSVNKEQGIEIEQARSNQQDHIWRFKEETDLRGRKIHEIYYLRTLAEARRQGGRGTVITDEFRRRAYYDHYITESRWIQEKTWIRKWGHITDLERFSPLFLRRGMEPHPSYDEFTRVWRERSRHELVNFINWLTRSR